MSRGFLSGGNCPGGICHVAVFHAFSDAVVKEILGYVFDVARFGGSFILCFYVSDTGWF